jgi:enoyl-CoA hydratase/carnithine racemase
VATVLLNRADPLNALDLEMSRDVWADLNELEALVEILAVMLR